MVQSAVVFLHNTNTSEKCPNMEIFPKLLKCANFVFGLRFSSDGKLRQLGLSLFFHIYYLMTVVVTVILIRKNDLNGGVADKVFYVSRILAAVCTMVKFFRIYLATEKIEKLTTEVMKQKEIIDIARTSAKISNYYIALLMTLIIFIIHYWYLYASDTPFLLSDKLQWMFVDMRDSAECDSMYTLCRYFHHLIIHLNRRLESVYDEIRDVQSAYPNLKLKIIRDIEQKDIDESISSIRKISKLHFNITKILEDFMQILSFNVALFIARKFLDIVSDTYFYVENRNDGYRVSLWGIIWVVNSVTLIILFIYSWVSCRFEANRTVIILHDIWNKNAKRNGVDKKLLYLQFISMRFLSCKLKFTAHGLFPLDWSFLHTMVASTATYIIILDQIKK